jgi:AhpD family alkylhydroperoxidase
MNKRTDHRKLEPGAIDRYSYKAAAPKAYKALLALEDHVRKSGLENMLIDLVYLRVSQINGCAFCVDMHTKDLRAAGEKTERIDCLITWREAPFYSPRERAALRWAEAVTRLGREGVDDASYEEAKTEFGEAALAELTLAIGTINTWNRLGIAFRSAAGSYQPARTH